MTKTADHPTKPRPLTARIHDAGSRFTSGGRLHRVPDRYLSIVCEACDWYLHQPSRLGRDHAERLRRQHLAHVHFYDQIAGRMVVNPDLADRL